MPASAISSLFADDANAMPATTGPDGSLPAGVDETRRGIDASDFERALAAVQGEIRAVPEAELMHITIDVRVAAVNTVARLPRLLELRDPMACLGGFDIGALDRLRDYALAAAHAYFLHRMSRVTPAEVTKLGARAEKRRSILLADISALVVRGLVDGVLLERLVGPVGYRNVAYDLIQLRNIAVGAWPRIAGKTALTTEELERDATLASRLLMAIGARSVTPVEPSEAALLRDQAFALFAQKYDQVRRAVTFVRWSEGDADSYAPSLYAGRGSRQRKEKVDDASRGTRTEQDSAVERQVGRA